MKRRATARRARRFLAVPIATLALGASAALALQTHNQGNDVETPTDGFSSLAGLATDPSSHKLYAADSGANRIDRFTASGAFEGAGGWGVIASGPGNVPANEHQELTIDATGGTYSLAYEGEPTTAIAFDATAAEVQTALEAIAQIGAGNVSVTGSAGGPYDIEFTGVKADTDVSELSADPTNLTGGAQSATIATIAQGGAAPEICLTGSGNICKAGVPGSGIGQFNGPQDVAVNASGDFFVADTNNNRIAAFDQGGFPLATFGAEGMIDGTAAEPGTDDETPAPGFSSPCGVAVDQANGNLFVADQNNNRIWIFDNAGAFKGKIADSALNGPCGLAFTSTGDLYIRNANDGKVLRFNRSAATDYSFASTLYNAEEGGATDIAVDTTSEDRVYVDRGDRIAEYEQFGGLVSTFGQGTLGFSTGIAIDEANDKVYVADGGALRTFSTAITTLPDVTTGAASNLTGESATLNGNLDALGIETQCEFEYDTDGSYASPTKVPCEPAGPFFGAEAVHADLTGLDPGTTYHYRLHAESAEGESFGQDKTFATDGAPIVESLSFSGVTVDAAELKAQVNPAGDKTTYRFEYTTQADFEANGFDNATKAPEPDGSLISANTAQAVTETITGLEAATRYEFRVVATNGIGTTESPQNPSPPKHFKTLALPKAPAQGTFPGQGFLPDNRAWELVSPPDKLGADVMPETTHIRAAADGSAIAFGSLAGFADVQGTGIMTSYLAQRTGAPGANGWATHAITPPQKPLSLFAAALALAPFYQGEFSDDLSKGVFRAFTPLTEAPNIAGVPGNLFLREDLRTPGPGSYTLLSDSAVKLAPSLKSAGLQASFLAGASEDFEHLIFESGQPLSGSPCGFSLFKHDAGTALPRRIAVGCAGSVAGRSAKAPHYTLRTISSDGSRVEFTVGGEAGRLFQLDDQGTPGIADDATIQLNASEASSPESPSPARFESASTDGGRVFFSSDEKLTDDSTGPGLYLWERQETGETQQVTVDAGGGTFTLTAHLANLEASTPPLAFNASAAQVQSALEALIEDEATTNATKEAGRPLIGAGNVSVSGGPGGSAPYEVTFTDALHGVNVPELTADGGGLSGGAATVEVSTTDPVHNLTLIVNAILSGTRGVIGASEDGHRLYFAGAPGLVGGEPSAKNAGIYHWQDADGTPGGTLSVVGGVVGGDIPPVTNFSHVFTNPKVSRVTPDGRSLIFEVTDGGDLDPDFEPAKCPIVNPNNNSGSSCSQIYLYRAESSTPTDPDVICVSCNPSGAAALSSAYLQHHKNQSAVVGDSHLSHALSDDGRYVFFSTSERLVAADVNGVEDAYVYDTQKEEPRLLSSGESKEPSYFADASADGKDAFILTGERLSGWDTDTSLDLYDAKVNGGLPEPLPAPPACQGDACQPAPTQLDDPTPASVGFEGAGNEKPPIKKCGKGKRRVKAKGGKTRCIKRHKDKNDKRAKHERRTRG